MNHPSLSLAESFALFFTIELAVTSEQKREAYEVRYRVYCEEMQYEPLDNYQNCQESDDYDQQALHVLIRHRKTGRVAGCVRIVETRRARHKLLPFEKKFPEALDPDFFSRAELDRVGCCEISRLAVDKMFRRRSGEGAGRLGSIDAVDITVQEYRTFSLIAETLFVAAAAITGLTGTNHIFALMEPYLCRLLGRSGIYFIRVGRDIRHHGLRAPYYVTSESIMDNLKPELLELYQSVYDSLEPAYRGIREVA